MLIGAGRWRALWSWRPLVFLQEICEASDQLLMTTGRQDPPTLIRYGSAADVGEQPIVTMLGASLQT